MTEKVSDSVVTGTTPARESTKLDLQKKIVQNDLKQAQEKWRPFRDLR